MDAQKFLAEFGHIANAPGGVARLRELVLQLALSGRLVEQIERDSVVENMLIELEYRRNKLLAERGLSSTRKHRNFETPKEWFLVPDSWRWEFLGYLSLWPLKDGDWIESKDQDSKGSVRIVQLADIGVGEFKDRSNRFLTSEKAADLGCYFIERNDILIARLPDPLGRACLFPGAPNATVTVVDVAVCRCDPEIINPNFLMNCLNAPAVSSLIKSWAAGTTRQRVATGRLGAIPLPIPPKEEQSRIVAKIDELMALCDKLEAQQQERRKLQNALRQSTLQAVVNATSPNELEATWVRLAENFGKLFSFPEDVVAVKGLVLDLAVSGYLLNVKSSRASSGTELLEKIAGKRIEWSKKAKGQEEKEALTMLKKLRAQKVTIPELSLPEHWAWASLLQVSQALVDCHNKTAPYVSNGIHLIRTTDIRNGYMDLSNTRKISEETYAYWSKRMPPKAGDIFFTREAPMGEAAIVPEGETVCLGQRSMLIRLFPELFNNRFLLYVIQSPSFQQRMAEAAVGMAVKHLRVGDVEDLIIPVPPKGEQDQIVNIIDKLFQICNHYENQLSIKKRIATNFASSAVANLTGITTEQKEEPMKSPQTELISPLRLGQTPDIKAQAPLATILARHNGEMSAKDLWQRFSGEIDAFYAQLKIEVAYGWIVEPGMAEVREKQTEKVSA
jgi:type I restriction enzyme S subunit